MAETDAQRLERMLHHPNTDVLNLIQDAVLVDEGDYDWLLAQAAQAQELRAALEAASGMLGNILWGNRNGGGPENEEIDEALTAARRALERKE